MAIAHCPFDQEVEDCGAKPCFTTTMGGGIAGGTTMATTVPALALASPSTLTAVATMVIVRHPFAQEVEDRGAKPPVTTTSRVSQDNYE